MGNKKKEIKERKPPQPFTQLEVNMNIDRIKLFPKELLESHWFANLTIDELIRFRLSIDIYIPVEPHMQILNYLDELIAERMVDIRYEKIDKIKFIDDIIVEQMADIRDEKINKILNTK